MSDLYELLDDRPATYRVLVSGLENWIDAGGAALRAVAVLAGTADTPDGTDAADDDAGPAGSTGGPTTTIGGAAEEPGAERAAEGAPGGAAEAPVSAGDPGALGSGAGTAGVEVGGHGGEVHDQGGGDGHAPVHLVAFDVDALIDHQARRPTMRLVDGVNVGLTWPRLDLHAMRDPRGEPFLLLQGSEPDHHWRKFAAAVVELARRYEVEMVVSLGAYPAPVPHSRPSRVVSTATTDSLAGRVGFLSGRMEVPASVNAAIEAACGDAGIPAIGLWAQVPHYVSNFPYPAASAALLDALAGLTGLRFPTEAFEQAGRQTTQRIDGLVGQNEEHRAMVRQLERLVDEQLAPGPLPSADELGAELEHFLRDQDDGS